MRDWLCATLNARHQVQSMFCVSFTAAGIVEAVLNGSTLRLSLVPDRTPVTVALAGVQCPSMGKRPPPAPAPAAEANGSAPEANGSAEANGTANGNGAAAPAPAAVTAASIAAAGVASASAPGGAEPLSREAKWFSESRVLNREVRTTGVCLLDGRHAGRCCVCVWGGAGRVWDGEEYGASSLVLAGITWPLLASVTTLSLCICVPQLCCCVFP
jgi:hypothetical protein